MGESAELWTVYQKCEKYSCGQCHLSIGKPDPRIPVIAVNVGNLSLDRIQVNDISSAGVLWIMSGRRM